MKTKPIHCFKSGRHITMAGEAIEFSAADVAAIAASYNPALHKAPMVVGHPVSDGPAFGGIASLKAENRGLFATPDDNIDPAFAKQVGPRGLNAVSCKFFRPDAPNNPVPGSWYLRHLGFLGQQHAAVAGMDGPSFGAPEDGCVCFQMPVEFAEYDDLTNASLWRRLREWLIGEKGKDVADSVIPQWDVQSLEQAAQDELRESQQEDQTAAAPAPAFAAPQPQGDTMSAEKLARLAQLEAESAADKAKLAEFAAAEKKRGADARHADHVSFAEGLIKDGKLLPAHKDVTVATLDHLASQEQVVEFGEGDGKQPLIVAYKAQLTAQPKLVEFGETAKPGASVASVEFASPAGFTVDTERLEMHNKALAYAAANKVSYDAALAAVSK